MGSQKWDWAQSRQIALLQLQGGVGAVTNVREDKTQVTIPQYCPPTALVSMLSGFRSSWHKLELVEMRESQLRQRLHKIWLEGMFFFFFFRHVLNKWLMEEGQMRVENILKMAWFISFWHERKSADFTNESEEACGFIPVDFLNLLLKFQGPLFPLPLC